MIGPVLKRFGSFARDNRGTLAVETALMLPMLAFWYMGTYVFFDAYKSYAKSIKASYTISDIISRERDGIDAAFIDGLDGLFDRMNYSAGDPWIRISRVTFDDDPTDVYVLNWSYATDGHAALTQTDINNMIDDFLPIMADDETLIITETRMPYRPAFSLALDTNHWLTTAFESQTWENLFVSRPRFANNMAWVDSP